MTKKELIKSVSRSSHISEKAARIAVDQVIDFMVLGIKKDEEFSIPTFGRFSVRKEAKRVGRNPQTGKPVAVKASTTVHFKPSVRLKSGL